MWKKEKLLITSNSSFFHIVFKRLILQTRKNQGLFGKGLNFIPGYDMKKMRMYLITCFVISARHQTKGYCLTLSQTKDVRELADDNFKFDENGRKFSKWVENTVGKGEIAHYERFLFPTVFSKDLYY